MEKLTEKGYSDLIFRILQSNNIDKELKVSHQNYFLQNGHWVYYQMLFRAIDKIKKTNSPEKDKKLLDALSLLESKLYDHTNIIPTDLPDWIVSDRHLINTYFTDHSRVSTNKESWSAFQQHIQDKLEEIPKEMKLPFLEWCSKMLLLNLKNHNKGCDKQGTCGVNLGYERQLQFISKMIEKAVSDQSEEIIIAEKQSKNLGKPLKKIQWLGNQKELAELFIRLKAKGWIAEFEPETIKECFTNANSIQQYLKPGEFTEDLGGTFEQVLTPEFVPKFHGIIQNPKRT